MTYFGNSSRMAGDPGFFGTLFGLGKRAARGAVGFATGGVGGAIASQFRRPSMRSIAPAAPPPPRQVVPARGIVAGIQRFVPGGKTGLVVVDPETGMEVRRRRRMNVGNAKALRRAIRRTDGFVRLAKGALKNTGFKIVSKSSGKVSRATMDKAVAAAHHRK